MPHKIRIIKRQNKCTVHPANLQIERNEKVNFRVFGTEATIFVPNNLLFDPKGNAVQVLTLADGQKSDNFSVNADTSSVKDGAYPYAIYCKGVNDFAEGNSSPTMIVE
jgi:hypothetical protein